MAHQRQIPLNRVGDISVYLAVCVITPERAIYAVGL